MAMSRTHLLFVTAALCAAIACSSQPEAPGSAAGTVAPAADAAEASPEGANTCLLDYQTRYDELLTLERAASAAGLPAGEAEVSYQKVLRNPVTHEVSYAWPSDRVRTMNVAGRDITVPRKNLVALGGIQPFDANRFRNSYRAVTDAELRHVDAAIDDSKDEALASEDQKSAAKGLAGIAAEITRAYREVPSVGDAASFNTIESKLYVLDRGVSFAITADVSDDAERNQGIAVALAQQVVDACR